MKSEMGFSAFWGCNIPINQPFAENAARLVFKRLNILLKEIEGATCCPENDLTRRLDPEIALQISSVNFALAERNKTTDMVTFCNGCYHSLGHALHILQDNNELKKVNEAIRKTNHQYKGTISLYSLVEYLVTIVGIDRIKEFIFNPLTNLKVACHFGCRLQEGNLPEYFKEVVHATGAQVIEYGLEKMCCGTPALYGDENWAVMERARKKLIAVKSSGADIIVVSCPACFKQFENTQLLLKRQKEKYDIPIFHITELLALAFGYHEKDIGITTHRIK